MAKLSTNWLFEKHIDFEYKQYLLLAYLKEVSNLFSQGKLYPTLAELIAHHHYLVSFKKNKGMLEQAFPKTLSEVDIQRMKLIYTRIIEDDELMRILEEITQFSLPQFEKYLNEGKGIYNFVEENICIEAVGIQPLYCNDGYLLLQQKQGKQIKAYQYYLSRIQFSDMHYSALTLKFIKTYRWSVQHTLQAIKNELIGLNTMLPNPATFFMECKVKVPWNETFVPIAKRMLMRHVNAIAIG